MYLWNNYKFVFFQKTDLVLEMELYIKYASTFFPCEYISEIGGEIKMLKVEH